MRWAWSRCRPNPAPACRNCWLGSSALTRARHREALVEAQAALGRALVAPEVALAAEDLRLAMRAIGRITGTVRIDELLDVIFRDFCIGK